MNEEFLAGLPNPRVIEALSYETILAAMKADLANRFPEIGPILALPGVREAIAAAGAPVIAVSPLVGGRSLKGPTEAFLRALGRPVSAAGVASLYAGIIDAIVADPDDPGPPAEGVRLLERQTLMRGPAERRGLAEDVLAYARELA